jgi:hypothetical protein
MLRQLLAVVSLTALLSNFDSAAAGAIAIAIADRDQPFQARRGRGPAAVRSRRV